ncbi:MAG TPA: HEXXH motif-containing putative peptide modification protein, partial [Allosphingosinicella sp.]
QIGEVAALRAAENVVHEAMHLQLSFVEQATPLVADLEATIRSPWKQEPRQLQGVLHGLYVFVCISAFFRGLQEVDALGTPGRKHVEGRLSDIEAEIASVAVGDLKKGLTPAGSAFLNRLLSPA